MDKIYLVTGVSDTFDANWRVCAFLDEERAKEFRNHCAAEVTEYNNNRSSLKEVWNHPLDSYTKMWPVFECDYQYQIEIVELCG
jgi:hypothetical protein